MLVHTIFLHMPEDCCSKTDKCQIDKNFAMPPKHNGKIVLLVKDQMLQIMHKTLFCHYGYRVKVISRPESLCDYLKAERPALVVFDMEMRKKLCRRIACFLRKAEIPVLLIISTGEECDVCKYLEPGLCDYVDSLTDELRLIIRKTERLLKQAGSENQENNKKID